jgi:hypothetical protein
MTHLSFDLAFNLNFEGLNSLALAGAKYNPTVKLSKKSNIGYLIEWTDQSQNS